MSRTNARFAEPRENIKDTAPIIRTRQTINTEANRKDLSQRSDLKLDGFDQQVFENLIDKKGLAGFLGVSVSLINKMVRQREIPYFKIGKLVRFNKAEVAAFLHNGRRMS